MIAWVSGLLSGSDSLVGAVFVGGLGFVLGGVTASFCGVVAERGWRGASDGRSVCGCGRQLAWFENVPVVGWLRSGGTARCCGSRIPVRYVVTETVTGVAVAGVAVLAGPVAMAVAAVAGGAAVIAVGRR